MSFKCLLGFHDWKFGEVTIPTKYRVNGVKFKTRICDCGKYQYLSRMPKYPEWRNFSRIS